MTFPPGDFSIFDAAQNLSVSGLAFPDADELCDARVRMIEKFCRPALPESLVNKAKESLELTKGAHAACEQFRLTAKSVSEQPLDEETLFLLAASILEKREQAPGAAGNLAATEKMAQARRVFLRAVVLNLRGAGSEKSLKEVLEECLVGVDGLDRITLTMQANLLAAQQKQLRITAEILPAIAYLSLIVRGLFYAVVIGKVGGKLERDLVNQKVMEVATEASWKVLGAVPGVSDLIDIVRAIISLCNALRDKEGHIDAVVEQIQSAQEYINAYLDVMTLWIQVARPVQDALVTSMNAFDPD